MANEKPTEQEAERLIKARKIVSASVTWKSENGSWRLEATALEPKSNTILRITGYIGKHNYSFCVLHRNYTIRKYTKHFRHKYKDKIYTEPHKHKWNEREDDAETYIPDDIDPKANINDQFLAFCKECAIDLKGNYQRVLYELIR